MPIISIGGALSDVPFNPKYACMWKVTVAVDNLGNIVWICRILYIPPGTSADVKTWDQYGPQHTKGCFMELEFHFNVAHGYLMWQVYNVL